MRSLPLLFAFVDGRWLVSDDINSLREALGSWSPNVRQRQLFHHLAYTLGDETLVQGVHAVEAAHAVTLSNDGSFQSSDYARYARTDASLDTEEFEEAFVSALNTAVGRLLEASGDRELVIPLSGGLDSRLLATWLKKLGAPRIRAFTYGRADSEEVGVSRSVADALGIDWFFIEYAPDRIRREWTSPEATRFRRANWAGTSLPHIQDWFALTEIRRQRLVAEDSIFLPGHTIVGSAHDEDLVMSGIGPGELARIIAHHHTSIQGRPRALDHTEELTKILRETAEESGFDGSPESALSWVEWFNLRNRQAKYINHSLRPYEFFGYSWAAPMLDREMWQTWLSGRVDITKDRVWYADFTTRTFAKLSQTGTDQQQGYYEPVGTRLPGPVKNIALKVMRAVGADRVLAKTRSIRTMLDHPMAFEGFATPMSRAQQVRGYLSGATSLGLWADMFLTNSWGNMDEIVPTEES